MPLPLEASANGEDELPLSIVVGTRDDVPGVLRLLGALAPQLSEVGGEAVVASCAPAPPLPAAVRWLTLSTSNVLELRLRAVREARGAVVAVGEDHTLPTPAWCRDLIRAHDEHPDAAAIAGCLVNATCGSRSGRANFAVFAAPFAAPLRKRPDRPPPISTASFKREALGCLDITDPGSLESKLLPRLFEDRRLVFDERVVLEHYQDHGALWSLLNAFHNTRANYGYAGVGDGWRRRRDVLRFVLSALPRRTWAEVRASRGHLWWRGDVVLVAALILATSAGAAVGVVSGPGRAADVVA